MNNEPYPCQKGEFIQHIRLLYDQHRIDYIQELKDTGVIMDEPDPDTGDVTVVGRKDK